MPSETPETRALAESWMAEADASTLERLRARWPVDGGGEGPREMAVLEARERGAR